jgi:hypothetical protein
MKPSERISEDLINCTETIENWGVNELLDNTTCIDEAIQKTNSCTVVAFILAKYIDMMLEYDERAEDYMTSIGAAKEKAGAENDNNRLFLFAEMQQIWNEKYPECN